MKHKKAGVFYNEDYRDIIKRTNLKFTENSYFIANFKFIEDDPDTLNVFEIKDKLLNKLFKTSPINENERIYKKVTVIESLTVETTRHERIMHIGKNTWGAPLYKIDLSIRSYDNKELLELVDKLFELNFFLESITLSMNENNILQGGIVDA